MTRGKYMMVIGLSLLPQILLAQKPKAELVAELKAKTPNVVLMGDGPAQHTIFKNDYVEVYLGGLKPGVVGEWHLHDHDTSGVRFFSGTETVMSIGHPDQTDRVEYGALSFGRAGRVHAAVNTGDVYTNHVEVIFLRAQGEVRNLCVPIVHGQPVNCTQPPAEKSAAFFKEPQYETEHTHVDRIFIRPHQAAPVGDRERPVLVVVIDDVMQNGGKALHTGDYLWLDHGQTAQLQNNGDKDARFAVYAFKP
jgi:hypothetical protein